MAAACCTTRMRSTQRCTCGRRYRCQHHLLGIQVSRRSETRPVTPTPTPVHTHNRMHSITSIESSTTRRPRRRGPSAIPKPTTKAPTVITRRSPTRRLCTNRCRRTSTRWTLEHKLDGLEGAQPADTAPVCIHAQSQSLHNPPPSATPLPPLLRNQAQIETRR